MIRFVAQRLSGQDLGRVSRPAIFVATAGVAVGLAVMIATLCVIGGFKSRLHSQVRSVGGDMQILNTGSLYQGENVPIPVPDSVLKAIRAFDAIEQAQRVVTKLGCLKTDSAFAGIVLTGIEGDMSLATIATQETDSLAGKPLADNEIIISQTQADKLNLHVGDKVMAYFFDETIRARRFTVARVYATHFSDIDDANIFAAYHAVHALTGFDDDECTYVRVFDSTDVPVADLPRPLQLLQCVRDLIPTSPTCQSTVMTIEELHPQLFSWLQLLDTNVVIIIVLMLCVSGFTMASGLFILILERTQMIGLMKALGARFSTLRHIFLYLAGIILVRGMLIGNLLALAMAFVQRQWHIVRLNPVDYYVDSVPIAFPWLDIALLNLGTLAITLVILIVPTYIISQISPVKALRFD